MKKIISVISCICILMSLFTMPALAEENVSVNEVYFYIGGNEVKTLSAGDVSSKLMVSNSGGEKAVNVIMCLYNESSRLEAVSFSQGMISAETASQAVRVPAFTVSNAQGREVRVFLWDGITIEPLDKMGVLNSEYTVAESIILHTADEEYEAVIDPETKQAQFEFTSFLAGATAVAGNLMPDMNGAYFTTNNGEELKVLGGEIDFTKPMTLATIGNGSSEKYTVNAKNYILHMKDILDTSREGMPSTRERMDVGTQRYDYANPSKQTRPLSGSNNFGDETDKALYFTHSSGYDGYYGYYTNSSHLKMVPKVADEIILSFDIRYDGFKYYNNNTTPQPYGDILIGQGRMFNLSGSPYAISFVRNADYIPSGVTLKEDQFVMGAFGGGAESVAKRKKQLNSPAMNMKQWYSIKQVLKINHVTGDYSYDYYLDGNHIGTVADKGIDTWVPSGEILGDTVPNQNVGVFNFYARTYGNTGVDFYVDNIKIEYSYGDEVPTAYLIGDSLMANRVVDSVDRQGHGYYFQDHFDKSQYRVLNMARSGHRAKFYLEGGNHESDGSVYAADWQHIKAHIKKGDLVIISVGLNDTYNWGTTGLKDRLKTMMVEAKERGAKVLAASETPYYNKETSKISKNSGLTNAIKTAAQESGVEYFDLEAAFYDELQNVITTGSTETEVATTYFVADGVHLTNAGAKMAAELLANATEKIMQEEATVTGATVTFEGIGKYEGLVNPQTHEITFYVDSAKYSSLDGSGNVKLASYSSDKLFEDFNDCIKNAKVNIKTNAAVVNNDVAQDFSNGPVTYKVGDDNWIVSIIETNVQLEMNGDDGLLTREDRLDLPTSKTGTLCWENKGKDKVETSIVNENGNNVFSFKKKEADAKSGVFAFQNMQSNGVVKQVESILAINSADIKIDELDEKEGFYFGFSSSRETSGDRQNLPSVANSKGALLFTRIGKQAIDDKISLKYLNSYSDKEPKAIENAAELDFNKWYNIKTVQKATENGGTYTITTEVYVDNIYTGEFSADYNSGIYRNIMVQFGAMKDSETTFGVKLDNLKTSYITTSSDVK